MRAASLDNPKSEWRWYLELSVSTTIGERKADGERQEDAGDQALHDGEDGSRNRQEARRVRENEGLPTGTVRHPSGRKMRKGKKIGSVRKQYGDWPF